MLISPETYLAGLNGKSSLELRKIRDSLLRDIREYEAHGGRDSGLAGLTPDTLYRWNLYVLSGVCRMLAEKSGR